MNKWLGMIVISCIFLCSCSGSQKQLADTWRLVQENAVTFTDGQQADLWQSDYGIGDVYKLSDGTTLLTVQQPSGPADVYVSGMEGFNDLNETAQKAILSYYEKQGLLYDVQMGLEKAYAEYLSGKEVNENFNDYLIGQDIVPTYSDDNIICFLTAVLVPIEDGLSEEIRLGQIFDKKTGEPIRIWELFATSEDESKKQLLAATQMEGMTLMSEMEKALKDEHIILFPDHLEIYFPQGSLPSEAYSFTVGVNYSDLPGFMKNSLFFKLNR